MNKDIEGWDYAGTSRDKSVGSAVTEGPGQKQSVRQEKRLCHRPRAWTELEAMGSRGGTLELGMPGPELCSEKIRRHWSQADHHLQGSLQ